jgi:hypothetical protein
MEKYLKTKIIKTLWEYGLNPHSLYILVYNDGSKYYRWETPLYISERLSYDEYWFNLYNGRVRSPITYKDRWDDKYELEIIKYNEQGKEIKKFRTRY